MKYFLIVLLLIIMAAGARIMFEIAYQALGREHDFAPANDTLKLMLFTFWFILMMVADVILLRHSEIKNRNFWIGLLTLGVLTPVIYQWFNN